MKNITISEYIEDLSIMFDKFLYNYNKYIIKKLERGKKLDDSDLYILAFELQERKSDYFGHIKKR